MKKIQLLVTMFLFSVAALAQTTAFPLVDKSPMDASYYPVNYPLLKVQDKPAGSLVARVIYSRPQKTGRTIFGGLVQYGQLWRLGANEATEIEFFKSVRIGGKRVHKGRYTLYTIPNETTWTIIVNKETDIWGAFKYDANKDVVRVTVPVSRITESIESLAMTFEKATDGINLIIAWDTLKVVLPVKL